MAGIKRNIVAWCEDGQSDRYRCGPVLRSSCAVCIRAPLFVLPWLLPNWLLLDIAKLRIFSAVFHRLAEPLS